MIGWKWATEGQWIEEKESDTEWKFTVEGGILYLAFQGSVSKMDWRQNFLFWKVPYRDQPVRWFAHAGFTLKWKSIRDDVLRAVRGYSEVRILGFSQGGAIATLAHEDIVFNKGVNVETVTFGSPRVISWWNWKKIEGRFRGMKNYRVRGDLVPHVPPWIFGYRHQGLGVSLDPMRSALRFGENHLSYGEILAGEDVWR